MAKRYIYGKRARAACDLIDELADRGISAAVGYPARNNGTLIVQLRNFEQRTLLPLNFRGYRLVAEAEQTEGPTE